VFRDGARVPGRLCGGGMPCFVESGESEAVEVRSGHAASSPIAGSSFMV
jgi:hypothetical protein